MNYTLMHKNIKSTFNTNQYQSSVQFEFKLFFHLQGVLTENYEFANMKTERKFNKTMMNLYAFLF